MSKASEAAAAKAALLESSETFVAPAERRRGAFVTKLRDVVPGNIVVLSNHKKDNGNWLMIRLHDGQLLVEDLGTLTAMHNDAVAGVSGAKRIFVGNKINEGETCAFLPTIKLGIKDGAFEIAA